jgi:hypothetical protein
MSMVSYGKNNNGNILCEYLQAIVRAIELRQGVDRKQAERIFREEK